MRWEAWCSGASKVSAIWGSSPIVANSVTPMAKAPTAIDSTARASRRAGRTPERGPVGPLGRVMVAIIRRPRPRALRVPPLRVGVGDVPPRGEPPPEAYTRTHVRRRSVAGAVSPRYAELHAHSAFSFLDGASQP